MNRILIAAAERSRLQEFADALAADPVIEVGWAHTGAAALAGAAAHTPLAVIVDASLPDMEGLELVRRLLSINAMIFTAVISELPAERFHEESEGLGVLAQLPPRPAPAQASELLGRLKRLSQGFTLSTGATPTLPQTGGGHRP